MFNCSYHNLFFKKYIFKKKLIIIAGTKLKHDSNYVEESKRKITAII